MKQEAIFTKIKGIAAKLCVPYCPGDKIILQCNKYLNMGEFIDKGKLLGEIKLAISRARDLLEQIEALVIALTQGGFEND